MRQKIMKSASFYFDLFTKPSYWPDLAKAVRLRLNPNCKRTLDDQREKSLQLCLQSINPCIESALNKLLPNFQLLSFNESHQNEVNNAKSTQSTIKTTMGGGANVDLLYSVVIHKKPTMVVETGVAYGWSSLAILSAIHRTGHGHLISIDRPYPGCGRQKNEIGGAVPINLKKNWRLILATDIATLRKLKKERVCIDVFHYDSDKDEIRRNTSYELAWDMLAPNGILISDDVNDNMAFWNFCQTINKQPIIIQQTETNRNTKYIGIISKT